MRSFTLTNARIFDGERLLTASAVRVADSRIVAIGDSSIARPGDELVAADAGFLMPGLIDAHVHLLPGAAHLAALFGVTTLIDQFSKPDIVASERAAGPAKARIRSSTIGAMLNLPALSAQTITALVKAAHREKMLTVAHVSTGPGAVLAASCGVDVLAHAPFSAMTDPEIYEVARSGVAVIATLSILDGFPIDGVMPLLAQPAIKARLTVRWQRVIERQGDRWMPPEAPNGAAQRENVLALLESGIRIIAGTDAPNPGLLPGPSLHRELQQLVRAGLRPVEALQAATSTAASAFGLQDRGVIEVGRFADLVLVAGNPLREISHTQSIEQVWVGGLAVDSVDYSGSPLEQSGIRRLRESNRRIVAAIIETWPGIPRPQDVRDARGELLGRVIPSANGWRPQTEFGISFGFVTGRDQAIAQVASDGKTVRDGLWWILEPGEDEWQQSTIKIAGPGHVQINGANYLLDDLQISRTGP